MYICIFFASPRLETLICCQKRIKLKCFFLLLWNTQNILRALSKPLQNMSSATTTNVANNVANASKPARKPTLPAKLSKFLVSNYSLIQALSAKGLLTDENVEAAYAEIKLFSSIEEQTEFYNAYLSSSKDVAKVMKKFVTVRNKPPKAPKAPRKPRVKKDAVEKPTPADATPNLNSDVEKPDATKAPKKPRTKKVTTVVDDSQSDVVKDLVEAANTPLEPKPEKAPRKRKPKKVAEPVPLPQPEVVEEEVEEIHTQEFSVEGKNYLIDGDNNLYSIDTHEQLATFDPLTKKVVPL